MMTNRADDEFMIRSQWWDAVHEVMIVYVALPYGRELEELICPNPDGTYTIFISTDLCEERQREVFQHALSHVKSCDFEACDVQTIEYEVREAKRE